VLVFAAIIAGVRWLVARRRRAARAAKRARGARQRSRNLARMPAPALPGKVAEKRFEVRNPLRRGARK
jgi:hypothetical protein